MKQALPMLAGSLAIVAATRPGSLPTSGKVTKVYDGDTLTIEPGGKTFNVRLAGIDTPERSYTRALNALERMADFAPLARRRELSAGAKPWRAWGTPRPPERAWRASSKARRLPWPMTAGSRHADEWVLESPISYPYSPGIRPSSLQNAAEGVTIPEDGNPGSGRRGRPLGRSHTADGQPV